MVCPVSVNGTLGGRVVDPDAAVTKVVDYEKASAMIAERRFEQP
jgi:hypothetical protein